MSEILGIIGSGDLGQQIAHLSITDNHFDEVVFFDDFTKETEINGYKILGKISEISRCYKEGMFASLIVGIGYKHMEFRAELYKRFNKEIPFANIIHSSSWIDLSVKLGKGNVIYPGSTIDANVVIEDNVLLNINTSIAHDTHIKSHCFLSPRVALAGFVNIGEQSILGINSTVIDNINIVDETQIGAGTVVIKNLDKKGLYVGNPSRFIR